MINCMSLFPNEDIPTKEIESWTSFEASPSSQEERKLFMNMLNDCYKYSAAAINAKGQPFPFEPLIMALLLSQHKMIDWLTKQISKYESVNNKKEVKKAKGEQEQDLGREIQMITSERIHYFDDDYY